MVVDRHDLPPAIHEQPHLAQPITARHTPSQKSRRTAVKTPLKKPATTLASVLYGELLVEGRGRAGGTRAAALQPHVTPYLVEALRVRRGAHHCATQ